MTERQTYVWERDRPRCQRENCHRLIPSEKRYCSAICSYVDDLRAQTLRLGDQATGERDRLAITDLIAEVILLGDTVSAIHRLLDGLGVKGRRHKRRKRAAARITPLPIPGPQLNPGHSASAFT